MSFVDSSSSSMSLFQGHIISKNFTLNRAPLICYYFLLKLS